ncbi:MAG: hypothetical protein M3M96_03270 [Candidatus Eremiobacteraeota bacterium]|nr:hypothetical protein [Candidatus Eremiobacteraeota bacterium]
MRFPQYAILAAILAAVPPAAGAQDHCSHETLAVRGTPVTVGYCADESAHGPSQVSVAVTGSYSAPGGSFSRRSTMHFITGEGPSRVLENVPLAQLGLKGILHLTLIYAAGVVRIESAMLTPGAVTIK